MSEMSRDDFISLMISELSTREDSENRAQSLSLQEVMKKFSFDFPLLEESHVHLLAEHIASLCEENSSRLPLNQFLTEKFVENVEYCSSADSYVNVPSVPNLCGALYVVFPRASLKMTTKTLHKIFPPPHNFDKKSKPASELVQENVLQKILALVQRSSSSNIFQLLSMEEPFRKDSFSQTIADALGDLVCCFVDIVTASTMRNEIEKEKFQQYISRRFNEGVHNEDKENSPEDSSAVVKGVMDAFAHTMFLIRDIISMSPAHSNSLLKKVCSHIFLSVQNCSEDERQLSTRKICCQQVHMILINILSELSRKFCVSYINYATTSFQCGMASVLTEHASTIVVMVEGILVHLKSRLTNTSGEKHVVAVENVFSSCVSIGKLMLKSFHFNIPVTRSEEVFLASQFLPFLIRTAFSCKDHTQLYACFSSSTKKSFICLLMELSLLRYLGSSALSDFISKGVFTSLYHAEELNKIAGTGPNFDILLMPSIFACTITTIDSNATKDTTTHCTSELSNSIGQAILEHLISLNLHCLAENKNEDEEDKSFQCSCSKRFFKSQKRLVDLLEELEYILTTLILFFPRADKIKLTFHSHRCLQSFCGGLAERLNRLGSSVCPAADFAGNLDDLSSPELEMADLLKEADRMSTEDDSESEPIPVDALRSLHVRRKKLIFSCTRNLKILAAMLQDDVSKTD